MAAPVLGILGQAAPAAATNGDLYAVPTGTTPPRRAVISTIVAAETGGVGTNIRIYVRKYTGSLAAAAVGNAIAYDLPVGPNGHVGFTEGITLEAGSTITVRSTAGGVTFHAFGNEEDVPTS